MRWNPAWSPRVLVVGAGPTGLVMACELLRLGTGVRLVERELAPHQEARATVIQARSLELLEPAGLAGRLVEEGQRLHAYATCTREGRSLGRLSFVSTDTAFPFALSLQQYAPSGCCATSWSDWEGRSSGESS